MTEPKWSPEQKQAIEESIQLWQALLERIQSDEKISIGGLVKFKQRVGASIGLNPEMKYGCPLCEKFSDEHDECNECPIEIDIIPLYPPHPIEQSCYYTPYADFERDYSNYRNTINEEKREEYRKQLLESCDAFLEYLKDLLKRGE